MSRLVRFLLPGLFLGSAGCHPGDESCALISVTSASSSLSLANGDILRGSYLGCRYHGDGERWIAVLGDPAASSLWVLQKNWGCQLWLSGFRKGTVEYRLYATDTYDLLEPVPIMGDFDSSRFGFAMIENDTKIAATMNVRGTGLDFKQPTFQIDLSFGIASAELGGLTLTSTLAE